ncbi:MAG: formate dehydrogenase subunit alpha [Rhodospirillales bacterium]|jgi:formate dehydrogenase major subunit|nr:formate dehydrogenase subunit alpha [Rhodospirillales bacterium]MBT4040883.1 formate dehydrogenase subunit alpha [Rhodospirillales bacterium]MBT4626355.1 formate dehydrogenase subunit alpha [Rhodospirillales bacterium]MBT5352613.1 formate dehydrogenase subunit alpha [Rhodospirillales bacterium]MBT5519320.1 formate dehydrogenase subunit alpha [Rhodospirillales bacterium]
MLRKKTSGVARRPRLKKVQAGTVGTGVDRRTFLKRSSLAAGGAALMTATPVGVVKEAKAATAAAGLTTVKSVCTHCSVGCTVMAEMDNGVWVGQEPGFDSPINLGAHCAKGASVREHAHNDRRLKYPMKLSGGKWVKMSWEDAINEIGDKMLSIREKAGPDSVYWLGSAKFNNEQSYLFRKFYGFWGSNNGDHQARICHSTTVAGVANTWGYGAMTNSYNDIHNSKAIFLIGSNPAEAHPVAVQHILKAKEQNNAALIVCDPRFTRTAAHADEYVRFRPGTDVALIWGILWHIFENEWEDKEFIRQRVWGLEQIRAEVKKWTPEECERVTGVPGEQVRRVARTMANNRPGTFVWCMGGTQHTNGNNNTRAYCTMQLVLGNMGTAGGGANIFRGHDNVQGATDFCILSHSLPGYYGLKTGSWKHWARVWDVDYDYLLGRFASKDLMESKGIPVSRWIDGVLEDKDNIDQPENLQAMVLWGHAVNSQTRLPEMKKAMEKLELMVIIDPVPTFASVIPDREDGVYVLPACTQFETYGSVTASNRSLQWRDKVFEPAFESKPDHEIMYRFAAKLGFADQMFKNIKVTENEPLIEDITREFNKGMWTIGYTGQSPERMRKQMDNQITFDKTTLLANGGPCDGEYYGLPWPCWGTPEMGHPGTPILYDTSKPVAEGGLNFRARFGVEKDGTNLLAEGSYPVGCEIKDGHPEFSMAMLKKLGWDGDLTADERAAIERVAGDKTNWKTDLSGGIQRVAIKHGCAPFGNAKARTVVWTFPDPVPLHREPLYTPRRDLVADYPTYQDKRAYRLPTLYWSIQKNDYSIDFPIILTSGRLVEYEGGGDESRSNKWLAELQQEMFAEINPVDANNLGIRDGGDIWIHSPEGGKVLVKAMVTQRVGAGVVFMPFHFGGHWQGKDLRDKYPSGTDPYVLGEASNMCGTYGYDSVTQMQETKVTLCRVEAA